MKNYYNVVTRINKLIEQGKIKKRCYNLMTSQQHYDMEQVMEKNKDR